MPIGPYKNFDACLKAGKSKAYCGKLFWKTHGKKEGAKKLKHEVNATKELLNMLLKEGKVEWNLSMYLSNRKDDYI